MRDQMPALILSVYLPHFLLEVRGTMEVKGKCVETSNIAALLDSQKRELRVSLSTFPQRAILLGTKCVIVRGVWHRAVAKCGKKRMSRWKKRRSSKTSSFGRRPTAILGGALHREKINKLHRCEGRDRSKALSTKIRDLLIRVSIWDLPVWKGMFYKNTQKMSHHGD